MRVSWPVCLKETYIFKVEPRSYLQVKLSLQNNCQCNTSAFIWEHESLRLTSRTCSAGRPAGVRFACGEAGDGTEEEFRFSRLRPLFAHLLLPPVALLFCTSGRGEARAGAPGRGAGPSVGGGAVPSAPPRRRRRRRSPAELPAGGKRSLSASFNAF